MNLPKTELEKQIAVARIIYPYHNWNINGEGCVPGEEGDESATRIICPDVTKSLDAIQAAVLGMSLGCGRRSEI